VRLVLLEERNAEKERSIGSEGKESGRLSGLTVPDSEKRGNWGGSLWKNDLE